MPYTYIWICNLFVLFIEYDLNVIYVLFEDLSFHMSVWCSFFLKNHSISYIFLQLILINKMSSNEFRNSV